MVEQWIENPRVGGSIPLLNKKIFYTYMTFQQINFLIELKNKILLGKHRYSLKYNFKILNLVFFLYKEGIIQSFYIRNEDLFLTVRFLNGKNSLSNLKIISKSSFQKNLSYMEICFLKSDKKIIAISTNRGILSLALCKKLRLGGKVLFVC